MNSDEFQVQDESGQLEPHSFISFDQALSYAYGISWVEHKEMFVCGVDERGVTHRIAQVLAISDVGWYSNYLKRSPWEPLLEGE